MRPPPHHQVLVVSDRADIDGEGQACQDGVDAADPALERLASADFVGSGPVSSAA